MKAWRFTDAEHGLELSDVNEPQVGDGQLKIKVGAAGLCHSDVGLLEGNLSLDTVPVTLGHEIAGVVTEVGGGVSGWKAGDKVAAAATAGVGTVTVGGFADYVLVPADSVVTVPDGVSLPAAAAATDAGLTAYHAVKTRGKVGPGMNVGIVGLGGLGMIGARVASLLGATVYAADPREQVHAVALEQGVTECATSISDFTDKGLDVIVDFAGMNTTGDAFGAIKEHGTVVQVGIGRPEATIKLLDVLWKQLNYHGSIVGTVEDLAEFLALIGEGKIQPVITEIGFDEVADGYQRLIRGEVTGRLVATF
jgi:propanol-preferring alcohol dehydrogenase